MRTRRTPEQLNEDRVGLMRTLLRLGEATYDDLCYNGHARWARNDLGVLEDKGLVDHKRDGVMSRSMYYKKFVAKYWLTKKGRELALTEGAQIS